MQLRRTLLQGSSHPTTCPVSRVVPGLRRRGAHVLVQRHGTAAVTERRQRADQGLRRKGVLRPRRLRVSAVFERFTERSIKSVVLAQTECRSLGMTEVSTAHILLGLIAEHPSSTASKSGFLGCGLSLERARAAVAALSPPRRVAGSGAVGSQDAAPFSNEVKRMFEAATHECKRTGVNFISPEHILLALLSLPQSTGRQALDGLQVNCSAMKAEAARLLKGDAEDYAPKPATPAAPSQPSILDNLCRDLCAEARAGRIDPVYGRDREVQRVCQILARRTKNNPILLGEPGVGKTAIAEGLAVCIVRRATADGTPLPQFLWSKRVLQLDIGRLIAGAKERGALEKRVTQLIAETKAAGNVILMIDEIHMLVGAGGSARGGGGGGSLDVSNLMKPALARGEFQVMGATTVAEHRKYMERDAALERRFQPVFINEPAEPEALQILFGLREKYERHHRCVYTDAALEAAVRLSAKYIADRHLPDKAIDLMDEAGSAARILAYGTRRTLDVLDHPEVRDYIQVVDAKQEAIVDGLFEEAFILRRREVEYRAKLCGGALEGSSIPVVDVADVERLVQQWTGIPAESMDKGEQGRLLQLASTLQEHLIGQPDAVDAVAGALRRARCGLKDPKRPIAALLFVGPTGVGKTELARVLAEQYFGSRDALIRLDMSEYMERHSVSKMIGAPPGFVGYGEGGKLTEAVRRRPCSLVLLDEVEKAHPDVLHVLLQMLEDGRLTDSQGRTVSFKNTLVILTSNVGSRIIAGSGGGMSPLEMLTDGRGAAEVDPDQRTRARLTNLVLAEVKACFKPELLNRFDEQVVFQALGRREVRTIYGLMLADTAARVAAKGYTLHVTERLTEHILIQGYSREYGVRPLRQAIVRLIDDALSGALLDMRFAQGSTLVVDWAAHREEVTVCSGLEEQAAVEELAWGAHGGVRVIGGDDVLEGPGAGAAFGGWEGGGLTGRMAPELVLEVVDA